MLHFGLHRKASDPLGQLNANRNTISSSILCFLWQQKENTKHVNSYIVLHHKRSMHHTDFWLTRTCKKRKKKKTKTKQPPQTNKQDPKQQQKSPKPRDVTPLAQSTNAYLNLGEEKNV